MSSTSRVGLAEVALMLGVTKTAAFRYSWRKDFPAPTERLATGRVWRRRDVERWAKKTLPLPTGRPRKRKSARRRRPQRQSI